MAQVIIYKQDTGMLAIIAPFPEALAIYGIDAIAKKDVPFGKRYKILDDSELPQDSTLMHTWTCDDADLTDGVGAESHEFPQEQS